MQGSVLIVGEASCEDRPDDELMNLVANGSQAAFAVLVRRYQQPALQLALRLLGGADEAQDVVQNAFVKVFRHRRRYRKRGQFRAFFLKVVLNEARMKLRRKRRRMNLLQKMSRQIQTLSDNTVAVATNPNSWPLLQKVRRHYRDVIALRYGAELKLEEIAEVLQIPVGTVKSRLFNGLRELKALLEAE